MTGVQTCALPIFCFFADMKILTLDPITDIYIWHYFLVIVAKCNESNTLSHYFTFRLFNSGCVVTWLKFLLNDLLSSTMDTQSRKYLITPIQCKLMSIMNLKPIHFRHLLKIHSKCSFVFDYEIIIKNLTSWSSRFVNYSWFPQPRYYC